MVDFRAVIEVVSYNLNVEPFLPLDGGMTSAPHVYLACLDGHFVGVLIATDRSVIDMVFVLPEHRRRGIASELVFRARQDQSRLGTDERLSAAGVELSRHLRLPLYGSSRRRSSLSSAVTEEDGLRSLRLAVARWSAHH